MAGTQSGFTNVQPPSPTTQTPFTRMDPRLSVGSYLNQQLGALNTGVGAQTGPVQSGNQTQQPMQPTDNSVQIGGPTDIGSSISQTNQNLTMLAQAKQRRDAAAAKAAQSQPAVASPQPQNGGGGGGGAGAAYSPNGQLSASRNKALATASSYLGSRYVLGGTSHQGIDCSGLVMAVYDQFGFGRYLDSHLAGHQARAIPGVRTSIANLRPGDLVCWNDGSHIAIYAGNGQIIEAANERVGTVKRKLWSSAVFGIALRLPGE
jgi:cell wall-associated NlpC family hydrolase